MDVSVVDVGVVEVPLVLVGFIVDVSMVDVGAVEVPVVVVTVVEPKTQEIQVKHTQFVSEIFLL